MNPVRESERYRKCNVLCCVYGCNNRARRNRELSFHKFPKQGICKVTIETISGDTELVDLHRAWVLALRREVPPSKYMKVCSQHFNRNDFWFPNSERKRKVLKKGAVPSRYLPTTPFDPVIKKETNAETLAYSPDWTSSVSPDRNASGDPFADLTTQLDHKTVLEREKGSRSSNSPTFSRASPERIFIKSEITETCN